MALIVCPECGKNISDKASACPHCGLPAEFFVKKSTTVDTKGGSSNSNTGLPNMPKDVNLQNLGNILVTFDKDYVALFNQNHYVSSREKNGLIEVYGPYYKYLKDNLHNGNFQFANLPFERGEILFSKGFFYF